MAIQILGIALVVDLVLMLIALPIAYIIRDK